MQEVGETSGEGDWLAPTATPLLAELVAARTPEPAATPGPIQREVTRLVYRAGLSPIQFLGLVVTDGLSLPGVLLLVLAAP